MAWDAEAWRREAEHTMDRVANPERSLSERREAAHALSRLAMDAWRELALEQSRLHPPAGYDVVSMTIATNNRRGNE